MSVDNPAGVEVEEIREEFPDSAPDNIDITDPKGEETENYTPHPFYQHCSPTIKSFLTDQILPLAKKYVAVYHTQAKVELDSKEPYKFAYEARKYLETCLEVTENALIEINEDKYEQEFKETDLYCAEMLRNFLNYQIGKINHEVEERSEAENMLMKCFECLKKLVSLSQITSLYCSVCSELGFLWAQRGEDEKAKEFLTCGLSAFEDYKAESAPLHINELFCPDTAVQSEEARRNAWERIHTHILYYLAQVYGNLGEYNKAAVYCRRTLLRQLVGPEDAFDPIEWSFNAATLSNYYSGQKRFAVARHCVACAHVVFYKYIDKVNLEELSEGKRDRIERNKADLARFWIKLAKLVLTEFSHLFETKVGCDSEPEEDLDKIKQVIEMSKHMTATAEKVNSEDLFEGIDVSEVESKVPVVTPTYREAKELFIFAQEQIKITLEFFPLNGYVTDHVEVLQEHSNLYKMLAKFELDLELKCRMHKRRVDLLEPPANSLNTQHYLMICRQMWYEIADTYIEMVGFKSDISKVHISKAPLKARQKYNKLNQQSHKYFQKFHDSIKPEKNGVYELELIRPLVMSKMGLSRALSNLICNEREQFRYMNDALKEYKWIVGYLEKHSDAMERCQQQYLLVKQMSELLPLELERFYRANLKS